MNASDGPPLNAPALSVRDLCVSYGPQEVVHHVSFDLRAGERLALLGESGSGKSTIGRAVLGLLPPGGLISRGTVTIGGRDLSRVSAREKDHMRGKVVSLVFQDPLSSLDPIKSIGAHMAEAVRSHANDLDRREVRERSRSLLEIAGLPSSEALLRQYPHELSGGMRQRVLIAAAVAHEPALIVADEPTSALDVKTQFEVLELLRRLSDMRNIGLLLITHDLVVAANTCESALVVRHGRILERGAIAEVFGTPKDPYTKDLMASMSNPRARRPGPESTAGVAGNVETALKMRGIGVGYGYGQARKEVLKGVDLEVMPGETIGVVGESGAGKTTLCRVLLGLVDAKCGEITVGSSVVNPRFARSHRRRRRNIQIVFQDPFTSMDPRMRVLDVVMQPLKVNTSLRQPAAEIAARNILAEMSVAEDAFERKVRELSGGQQQRVAIARALVLEPDVVVLDEPTSALDAALRIQVLDLLRQKQIELGSAYVFITHDLLAARYFCDRIAVLKDGAIVEVGTAREIFSNPRHLYTTELVNITLAAEHGSTKLGIGKAKSND